MPSFAVTPAQKAELERQAQANPGGYSEIGPDDNDDDRDSDDDFMEAAGAEAGYMSVNPDRPSSGYFDVHPDPQ